MGLEDLAWQLLSSILPTKCVKPFTGKLCQLCRVLWVLARMPTNSAWYSVHELGSIYMDDTDRSNYHSWAQWNHMKQQKLCTVHIPCINQMHMILTPTTAQSYWMWFNYRVSSNNFQPFIYNIWPTNEPCEPYGDICYL